MKKILFLLLVSTSAFGANISRYAGADIHYSYHKFVTNNYAYADNMNGFFVKGGEQPYIAPVAMNGKQRSPLFHVYHGWRIDDVAFEYNIGVLKTWNESEKRRSGTLRKKFVSLQCLGYIPCFKMFELFFGGGLSIVSIDYDNLDGQINFITQKLAKRVTTGLQFPINDKMNLRSSFIWHDLKSFKSHQFNMDNHIHFGLGVNYLFE